MQDSTLENVSFVLVFMFIIFSTVDAGFSSGLSGVGSPVLDRTDKKNRSHVSLTVFIVLQGNVSKSIPIQMAEVASPELEKKI